MKTTGMEDLEGLAVVSRNAEPVTAMDLADVPCWIQGEKKLLIGLLERAVFDCRGGSTISETDTLQAREWLFDEEATTDDEWTFPWVCLYLDIDADSFREKIKRFV